MRVFSLLILFLSFYGFFSPVFAQIQIMGRIVSASQEPLMGATIILSPSLKGTQADTQGNFSLSGISVGKQALSISFIGYKTKTLRFDVQKDTSLVVVLSEDIILAKSVEIYGSKEYPITSSEVTETELIKQNLGQDLPILLNFTPSVVTTSDAGAGVGYTGIRIRGSDATRTNVTINGIPFNDAESQGTYWVNLPDIASSVNSVQIQRGVGTSVNGAGAFGASMNISTQSPSETAYAETNNSYGSFNTWKHNIKVGTGKINNRFSFDTRLSKISSDGYIDNAFSDLKSFFASGNYQYGKTAITANVFSGKEVTFQAWNGVSEEKLKEGKRTYNELAGYDNETDNYQQDHYQFIVNQGIGNNWNLHAALHYTKGRGYYEQYKTEEKLSKYGLDDIKIGDTTIKKTDLIRRRWLDNDFYGIVYTIGYQSELKRGFESVFSLNIGGAANTYKGKHFGEVIWAKYMSNGTIRHRYYDNDGHKTDVNAFVKANYQALENLFIYADLQVRNVGYDFFGYDNNLNNVTQSVNLTFFNPKFGLKYSADIHQFYASYARGNKEPNRDDYTQSTPSSRPQHETLDNIEIGWGMNQKNWVVSANYYLMSYKNQLILTGKINDVGEYTRTNVANSYRTGIEISSQVRLHKLSWGANLTLSQNKIKNFSQFLDEYDADWNYVGQKENKVGKTDIAFSPALIASSQLEYTLKEGFSLGLLSKYVSRQYLDNTSTASRSLKAFLVNDFRVNYTLKPSFMNEITFSLLVNNLLDKKYEPNGYTYGYIYNNEAAFFNYYYPQAGRNFLVAVRMKF